MKVARHWIRETVESLDKRGRKLHTSAWGWSAASVDEARQRARATAERVLQWLADPNRRDEPRRMAEYTYFADRPPREEIVEEFLDPGGEPLALVTRNAYGSLVLNARNLMFVDIDDPPTIPNPLRLIRALFGKKLTAASTQVKTVFTIRAWCAANPHVGMRLYRTAAGFRACLVDQPRRADDDESRAILNELGADPLYCQLCDVQQCFRARLTPKPWRIDLRAPADRYPFVDPGAGERYREWLQEYNAAAANYATCSLVETHGPSAIHPTLAPLVELHDSLTTVKIDLPLA
jgi:hypothetical protein